MATGATLRARWASAQALLWISAQIPAIGLVYGFPEHRLLALMGCALWGGLSLLATALVTKKMRAAGVPDVRLLRLTVATGLLTALLAVALTVALCAWPMTPSDQTSSDWINLGAWPAIALLLIGHGVATGTFLLVVSYTSSAALLQLAFKKRRVANRGSLIGVLTWNAFVVVLSVGIYSTLSARRFVGREPGPIPPRLIRTPTSGH